MDESMQSQKELAFTDDEIYTTQTQEKPSGLVDVDSRPQKDIVLVELLIIPENTFHSEILQRTTGNKTISSVPDWEIC